MIALLPVGSSAGGSAVEFEVTGERVLVDDEVRIALVNNTSERIELFGGGIYSLRTGKRMVPLEPTRRFLAPGGEHGWTWLSSDHAGRFEARFRTSSGRSVDRFQKGAFFTLGFDNTEHTFVIWVREMRPIRGLRNDLAKAQDERRIVSGIVSRAKGYNPDWSYTMGPASIVLGDVFMEVCDANPTYVENHRRAWMGERWCPWSSYVASESR